ncbi:MAG: CDP-alcohol phosphatidyltransferase family protein [Rhodoferax sp.]|nr:CDP-alcohol phosphatidyltransferase family protein [Actinomycetota bacterium]
MSAGTTRSPDRVVTVPDALSALRLVGVPVFVWLLLARHDGWAVALLAASGVTDYLDGKIARSFGLESRIGALLDPLADRLYILTTLLGLAWRSVIPWWLVIVLLGRELFLAALLPLLRSRGYGPLPVHFVGKAATAALLYAFPLLLLGDGDGVVAAIARPVGWGFVGWGTALYWVAGVMYAIQTLRLVRATPAPA